MTIHVFVYEVGTKCTIYNVIGYIAAANVNAKDSDGDTPLHNCVAGRRSGGGGEQV